MKKIILKGYSASKGVAEGEALVTHDTISFVGTVYLKTGVVVEAGHELKGKSIAEKVLVFPVGKGSSADPYGFYFLKKGGKAPKAIVNIKAQPTTVVGAIIADTPMVYGLDRNPLEVIQTGDLTKVDANKGIVTVTKKSAR